MKAHGRLSCKTLTHEIGHRVFFHCLVNGCNRFKESDAHSLQLCRVDLRKLHHSNCCDPLVQYLRVHSYITSLSERNKGTFAALLESST